jgi:hypothetical protein
MISGPYLISVVDLPNLTRSGRVSFLIGTTRDRRRLRMYEDLYFIHLAPPPNARW